jgi:hypothetical protein
MTLILIVNGILAAAVLVAIVSLAAWAIGRSHHEGRPVTVGAQRRWVRHTISLRSRAGSARTLARPFA